MISSSRFLCRCFLATGLYEPRPLTCGRKTTARRMAMTAQTMKMVSAAVMLFLVKNWSNRGDSDGGKGNSDTTRRAGSCCIGFKTV